MHLDPTLIRAVALGLLLVLIFGSRLTKGSVRQTPDGLVFGTKPVILWTRIIAVPGFLFAVVLVAMSRGSQVPWIFYAIVAVAIAFLLYQMPGTIILTPTTVTQKFWLQPTRVIQYNEVMALQSAQAGRAIRVLGDNRVKITHSMNHCASAEFQQELEHRTSKRLIT